MVVNKIVDTILNISLRLILEKVGLLRKKKKYITTKRANINDFILDEELDRLYSLPRFHLTKSVFLNNPIKLSDNGAYISMVNEIFVKANYHFECASPTPYIVDCGSNIGLSVIYFKCLYPNAKIIAIEPDPVIFGILKENIGNFSLSNVTCENAAVWTSDEMLTFISDGSWGGHLGNVHEGQGKPYQVKGIDITNLINTKTNFLKLDIEGAEAEVLMNSKELIVKNVDHLFFEWHSMVGRNQRLGEILSYFEGNGFRYHIKEASERISPFTNMRSEGMDSQLDCFLYKM